MTKSEIFSDLHYIFFFDFSFIWFFFMFECQLCKKILIIMYINDYSSLIIQIELFWFFTLAAVETQMLPSEERRQM